MENKKRDGIDFTRLLVYLCAGSTYQAPVRDRAGVLYAPHDPGGIIPEYIHKVQIGKLDIRQPAPEDVLDLLKTVTPADFNNSPALEWRYVILRGAVWRIEEVPTGYQVQNEEEQEVLNMLEPEHRNSGIPAQLTRTE